MSKDRLPKRYPWPFTQRFYSICSSHYIKDPDCSRCRTGMWHSDFAHFWGHLFHEHAYPVWHWWANRPNSPTRKFLRSVFPNLK